MSFLSLANELSELANEVSKLTNKLSELANELSELMNELFEFAHGSPSQVLRLSGSERLSLKANGEVGATVRKGDVLARGRPLRVPRRGHGSRRSRLEARRGYAGARRDLEHERLPGD